MKLLDLDILTDTDLEEMVQREVPCGLPAMITTEVSWCKEIATHSTTITCLRCRRARRIFTCTPCSKWLRFALRISQPLGMVTGHKLRSGGTCWPAIFRMRSTPLT